MLPKTRDNMLGQKAKEACEQTQITAISWLSSIQNFSQLLGTCLTGFIFHLQLPLATEHLKQCIINLVEV